MTCVFMVSEVLKELDESIDALDELGQHGLLTLTVDFNFDHG